MNEIRKHKAIEHEHCVPIALNVVDYAFDGCAKVLKLYAESLKESFGNRFNFEALVSLEIVL